MSPASTVFPFMISTMRLPSGNVSRIEQRKSYLTLSGRSPPPPSLSHVHVHVHIHSFIHTNSCIYIQWFDVTRPKCYHGANWWGKDIVSVHGNHSHLRNMCLYFMCNSLTVICLGIPLWHSRDIYVVCIYFICDSLHSLLDVLADRKSKKGLSGAVLINGQKRLPNFKTTVGYVVQVSLPQCV